MLNIKTLNMKKIFTKSNGDKILDLIKSSIKYKSNIPVERVVYVTKEFVMRPDLVADAVYGDADKFDFILKYNSISNPFSIYDGQYLYIPERSQMEFQFTDNKEDDIPDDSSQAKIKKPTDKRIPVDINRTTYLENVKNIRSDRNTPVETISPNVVEEGDSNIIFKDNKIIFGNGITTHTIDNCPELSTKARVKEALLSKRSKTPILDIGNDEKINSLTNVNKNNKTQ